jgi:hypothetical protein
MNKHFSSRRTAHFLGFAGLIPFVVLSLGSWIVHPDWLPRLIVGQLSYGVAILSFLGGLHWGAAILSNELSIDRTKLALLWGVTPSLIGVAAAQLLLGLGFLLMTVAFVVAYRVDRRLYSWYPMPGWLMALRFRLTCVVVASLLLTFLAVNVRR